MKNQKKSNIKRKCFLTAAVLLFAAIVTACIFYVNHKRAFSVSPLTQSMIDELDLKDASKLMIVAHPDDETIWGGAHLLDRGYLVVCLTDGYNKKRASEFNEAVKASGNTPLILDYPDKVNFKRADWSEITDDIEADIELIMSAKHWDIAVTHNPKGEYGHIHHKKTNAITVNAFNKTNGTSQIITINKANINIVIDEYKEYYGSDKKIKITVTNAATGDPVKSTILHLYLPVTTQKDYYFQTNENGTSEINVNGFVGGTYDLTISNNDTKNINSKSVDGSFTILKIPVVINSKDVTVYYNTGTTAKIKVTQNGKPLSGMYVLVTLYATSTKYSNYLFQTNSKGEISFSASLTVGKHKMIINSADNRYDAKQVTPTITVKKATGKFTAKKVTTYYKAGKYFTLKLTNTKKKKPIYDAKVNIKIFISKNRYYNYNGKTGMNGQIKLLLDTLKPGSYKVVISCADKKDYSAKEITSKIVIKKAPAKLTPKKMTAKKGAKKFFQVKVKNKKTKKVIKGVKVKIKVYTGKKAKTFTAKTNAKGIAKISTAKLKVGKHKVVVTSANKYVVAKKAKSTIKIKK